MPASGTQPRTERIAAFYRTVVKDQLGAAHSGALGPIVVQIIAINLVLLGLDVLGHLSLTF